jgi:hypothetical protein
VVEAVKLKISERDDIADLLALIPPWFVGAVFWVAISELVLKRLYPDDFIKLQAAILGADIVGDMPPGVAMVAIMYNTLYAVEVTEDITEAIVKELSGFGAKAFSLYAKIVTAGITFAGKAT